MSPEEQAFVVLVPLVTLWCWLVVRLLLSLMNEYEPFGRIDDE